MQLNAENLKAQLWSTLLSLKEGKTSAEDAKATAMLARETLRVVNTEINVAVLSGKKPTAKMLTAPSKR